MYPHRRYFIMISEIVVNYLQLEICFVLNYFESISIAMISLYLMNSALIILYIETFHYLHFSIKE